MTQGMDDLKAQVAVTDAKIDAAIPFIKSLQDTNAALLAKIASMENVDPELESLAADLKAHTDGLSAALNPPAPEVPTEEPTA